MADTKRDTVMLTPNDKEALKFISEKNVLGSDAQALRLSVVMQTRRDEDKEMKRIYVHTYKAVRETCVGMHQKSHEYGKDEFKLKMWTFWRTDEISKAIDTIMKTWEFEFRAEAVKFAIRVQATLDGFTPDDGW